MAIVMELEPQYPLIWLWSRKVERRWVVIWSWLDGKRFRCHVVVELYFSELKASRCRKVVSSFMVLIFGSRLKSERLRDHGEEGTNAVSYEPAADKTRHQGETLR
ncbi:hypothetical protein YC2023_066610 [Brassica napus]